MGLTEWCLTKSPGTIKSWIFYKVTHFEWVHVTVGGISTFTKVEQKGCDTIGDSSLLELVMDLSSPSEIGSWWVAWASMLFARTCLVSLVLLLRRPFRSTITDWYKYLLLLHQLADQPLWDCYIVTQLLVCICNS